MPTARRLTLSPWAVQDAESTSYVRGNVLVHILRWDYLGRAIANQLLHCLVSLLHNARALADHATVAPLGAVLVFVPLLHRTHRCGEGLCTRSRRCSSHF